VSLAAALLIESLSLPLHDSNQPSTDVRWWALTGSNMRIADI